MSTDSYVNCAMCGTVNDVSGAVELLSKPRAVDISMVRCKYCGSAMSVVITIQGVRTVEGLIMLKLKQQVEQAEDKVKKVYRWHYGKK